MPTQPIGWAVVQWFQGQARPKRLYTGDRFIAERIYKRTIDKLGDEPGRVELLDTRNVVRQEHGYHQDRIPQDLTLKSRKAQLLDVIDHSLSCSDSSESTSGTGAKPQRTVDVPAAKPPKRPKPTKSPVTVATPIDRPLTLPSPDSIPVAADDPDEVA